MYTNIIQGGDFMTINNPLRYPGAKSKLVPYIKKLIEAEKLTNCTLYEPYAGSAAVSLALLESETISKAVINELDPLIYCFWKSVMNDTDNLINLIEKVDITLDNWIYYSQYKDSSYIENKSTLEIGFAGLYLNRTSFSGILNANPLGGMK
jgi:DNA adenine methylase